MNDNTAVVTALVFGVVLTTAGFGSAGAVTATTTVGQTEPAPDDVLLRIDLTSDGTADWTVEHRIRLDDENTTDAFESFRADVESNESLIADPFERRMETTVAAAADETGRGMVVRNVTVDATRRQLPQEYGIVTYRFTWEGFAESNETTLRAGDALAGFFLDERTTLLVTYPADHRVVTVAPSPDERRERTVVWTGPIDFGPGEPSLVVERATAQPTDVGAGTEGPGALWLALAVILLGALGVAGWVVRRRSSGEPDDDAATVTDRPEPTEDLLSNEERVLAILDEHGGRVKQREVADALDWTDAKTSQVVTSMREDGRIESFRLGRENVLVLPDDEE